MRTDVLEAEPATHDHASRTEHPDTSTGYRTTHTHTHERTHAHTHASTHARTHTQQNQLRTEHPNTKDTQTPTSVWAFMGFETEAGSFRAGSQGGFLGCLGGFGVLVRGLEVEGANANVVRKQEQGSRAVCSWGPRAASGRWLWELCLTEGSCPVDHCPNSSGLRLTGSRRRI